MEKRNSPVAAAAPRALHLSPRKEAALKEITVSLAILVLANFAFVPAVVAKGKSGGSHSVRGHVKKDGTYVAPHRSTNPDGTKSNNWSQKGNVNPYTGNEGTKE